MNTATTLKSSRSLWQKILYLLRKPIRFNFLNQPFSDESSFFKKTSKDSQRTLQLIYKGHATTLRVYKLTHRHQREVIFVVFRHLGRLRQKLDNSINKYAQAGLSPKVHALVKQKKNIRLDLHTHRLQIFKVSKQKNLCWLMDLDFHKETSYGSGTGAKVLQSFLLSLLEQPYPSKETDDWVESLLSQDLDQMICQHMGRFYSDSETRKITCLVSPHFSASSPSETEDELHSCLFIHQ